jgi:hypothetical protein
MQHRQSRAGGYDNVGVLRPSVRMVPTQNRGARQDALVAACWVLAEVDLYSINLGWDPVVRHRCGRNYPRNNNPLTA